MPKSRKRKLKGLGAQTIAKLGLLGITLGAFGWATNNASAETNQAITEQAQAVKEQPKKTVRKSDTMAEQKYYPVRDRKGSGMRPKEYGQYLQATGRQKWNKSSGKTVGRQKKAGSHIVRTF